MPFLCLNRAMSKLPEDSDDQNLFREAMRGVNPLGQDKHKKEKPKSVPRKHIELYEKKQVFIPSDFNKNRWVDGEKSVSRHQTGLQPKTIKKLKRGELPINARLDLHHYKSVEAIELVDDFLDHCRLNHYKVALIIHGKGYMSQTDKPILKNMLIEYLRQNSNVLAYHSAAPKDGGTGALYVLIKSGHKI